MVIKRIVTGNHSTPLSSEREKRENIRARAMYRMFHINELSRLPVYLYNIVPENMIFRFLRL